MSEFKAIILYSVTLILYISVTLQNCKTERLGDEGVSVEEREKGCWESVTVTNVQWLESALKMSCGNGKTGITEVCAGDIFGNVYVVADRIVMS